MPLGFCGFQKGHKNFGSEFPNGYHSPTEFKKTHGMKQTRTYHTWENMIQRTTNPNATQWKWYGGRGIKVCLTWLKFENFLLDMGIRPDNTSIDRINPVLGYYKENCRWATAKQQANNRRKCATT
jgi:hypothetical protein